jgi:hypothetical protein
LQDDGMIDGAADRLHLTRRGLLFADGIIAELAVSLDERPHFGRNLEGGEPRLANEVLVRGADVQDRLAENHAESALVGRELERGLGLVGNGGLGGSAAHRKKSQDRGEASGAHRVSS